MIEIRMFRWYFAIQFLPKFRLHAGTAKCELTYKQLLESVRRTNLDLLNARVDRDKHEAVAQDMVEKLLATRAEYEECDAVGQKLTSMLLETRVELDKVNEDYCATQNKLDKLERLVTLMTKRSLHEDQWHYVTDPDGRIDFEFLMYIGKFIELCKTANLRISDRYTTRYDSDLQSTVVSFDMMTSPTDFIIQLEGLGVSWNVLLTNHFDKEMKTYIIKTAARGAVNEFLAYIEAKYTADMLEPSSD